VASPFLELFLNPSSISLGKYRISSLPRRLDDGRYHAGVSIRSGRGSATTDRVMRFTGHFACEASAHRYAHEQGALWVHLAGGAAQS
jgi:hypothetical protein